MGKGQAYQLQRASCSSCRGWCSRWWRHSKLAIVGNAAAGRGESGEGAVSLGVEQQHLAIRWVTFDCGGVGWRRRWPVLAVDLLAD
jgi:hypothetical protein